MRPLRSFLLLLILLACFTGLHYVIPVSQFFPSINEFFSPDLLSSFFPENKSSDNQQYILLPDSQAPVFVPVDSISLPAEDTITVISDPLKRFTDSLRYSEGQVRIMYYGDSQIEGDRITSFLRHILREQYGGAGPGLFCP